MGILALSKILKLVDVRFILAQVKELKCGHRFAFDAYTVTFAERNGNDLALPKGASWDAGFNVARFKFAPIPA